MAQLTIQQAMQLATQHHQAGRLQQAQEVYRQVLAVQPDNADALNLLGVAMQQLGRDQEALELLRKSVAVNDRVASYQSNLGVALERLGRLQEAADCQRRAMQLDSRFAPAYSNLASVLVKLGQAEEAARHCRQAIELRPAFAPAHQTLGAALDRSGDPNGALAAYTKAIALAPAHPEGYNGLAVVLGKQKRYDHALEACRKALERAPQYAPAHNTLGNILREQGRLEDALTAHREAIRLNPGYAEAHYNLGVTLQRLERFDNALQAYQQALQFNPALVDAHVGLATAMHPLGRSADAIACYRRALELDATCAEAHWGLALELLLDGRFEEGWKRYDWRWRCKSFAADQKQFAAPLWDGSDISGRIILLHMEQGLGDAIQFVRYASLLNERGVRVVVQCDPALIHLLATAPGVAAVVAAGQPLPPFDVHCPMLSLPARFGTTLHTIPARVPYLSATAQWAEAGQVKLATAGPSRLRVGLVWAGNPAHTNDRHRSIALRELAPLGQVEDVTLVSLQQGPALSQCRAPDCPLALVGVDWPLADFAQTAGLVANLDLVISVDTAVAHLAGALAKPVWTLLPDVPDWRWVRGRADTPWYPTMRLFRQTRRDDWASIVQQVAAALRQRVG